MIGWICCALALVLCAAVLVWRWRRERALFDRLDDMLDAAVEGRFHASDFDESQLSAFESRLAQYLQAGADSSLRLAEQRDQIAGLVSDVSHQTKTPVANIRLYSQLLAEEPLSAQGAECAAVIAAQAEKLDGLIQGLVKSSRLETGILALHPRETVLAPLVRSAASQYAAKAEAAGVALSLGKRRAALSAIPSGRKKPSAIFWITPSNIRLPAEMCSSTSSAIRCFARCACATTGQAFPKASRRRSLPAFIARRTPTTSLVSASGSI